MATTLNLNTTGTPSQRVILTDAAGTTINLIADNSLASDGQIFTLILQQDSTGARAVTYGAGIVGGQPVVQTAGASTIQMFCWDAAGAKWNAAPGFGQAFTFSGLFNEFAANGLTAAGTTQANALATTTQTTRLTTVAAGTGILLPPSAAGLEVMVINHGANAVMVYGAGTDTIDDIATATGVSQMQNSLVIYTCANAGSWYSEGLATGFSTSSGAVLQTVSSADAITPHSGGGQGLAVLLTKMMNRSNVGAAADSLILPVSQPGMNITYYNGGANAINVFPATGEAINALGANAAFSVATVTGVIFYCFTAGQWFTK